MLTYQSLITDQFYYRLCFINILAETSQEYTRSDESQKSQIIATGNKSQHSKLHIPLQFYLFTVTFNNKCIPAFKNQIFVVFLARKDIGWHVSQLAIQTMIYMVRVVSLFTSFGAMLLCFELPKRLFFRQMPLLLSNSLL